MKQIKLFITSAVCIALTLTINAQEFNFGGQAGFVISHSFFTDTKNNHEWYDDYYNAMPSFSLNVYAGYKSSNFWGVSVLPGYIQKGASFEYTYMQETTQVRQQLHYVNVPLLFDVHFLKKFSVSVGPEFAFLLKANVKSNDSKNDISDMFDKNFELSLQAGMCYNLWQGLSLGANYSRSLTSFRTMNYTDNNGDPLGELNEFNQYGQLFVRYVF